VLPTVTIRAFAAEAQICRLFNQRGEDIRFLLYTFFMKWHARIFHMYKLPSLFKQADLNKSEHDVKPFTATVCGALAAALN
jgi:hypothetical protein